MAGLFPRPKVHHGRCYLEVRGFSTQPAVSIRTAEMIAAARIVKNRYGGSYDSVLFGGGSAVERQRSLHAASIVAVAGS